MDKKFLIVTVLVLMGMTLGFLPLEAKAAESDFVIENGELKVYKGSGGVVVIPDGVTTIGSNAFYENTNVTSITLPDSVTVIRADAFNRCRRLKNIRLSKCLKEIGARAFQYCESLTNITIPESVTHIGYDVFKSCNKLEAITASPKFQPQHNEVWHYTIGIGEFSKTTTHGKQVRLYVLDKDENSFLAREATVAGLPLYQLMLNSDNVVLSPGAVYELRMNSHAKCDKWSSSNPSVATVNHYGRIAAKKTGVTVITAELYGKEFSCKVTVKNGSVSDSPIVTPIPEFWIEDGVLFEYNGTNTSITVPDGVTTIGRYAFYDTPVTAIKLPDSVTTIADFAFASTDLFYTSSLKEIRLSENLETIGNNAFSGCQRLTSITIPDSVTIIGKRAFAGCRNLKNIRLSNSLERIETNTFCNCHALKNVTIPESVEYLAMWAFDTQPTARIERLTVSDNFITVERPDDFRIINNRCSMTIYVPEISDKNYILTLAKEYEIPVKLLALQSEELTLKTGSSFELRMNSYAKCDSWTSSNPAVATVNYYGKITAKKPGTTMITATLYGKEYQCEVMVK